MNDVFSSLEVENEKPFFGNTIAPSAEEIKQRAYGAYSTQNRAVTKEDYVSLLYKAADDLQKLEEEVERLRGGVVVAEVVAEEQ